MSVQCRAEAFLFDRRAWTKLLVLCTAVWDPLTGTVRCELTGHTNCVAAIPIADYSTLLASGDNETVRLWDPLTGESRGQLTGHTDCAMALLIRM